MSVFLVKKFYDCILAGETERAIEEHLADAFVWENPLPEGIPYGGTFPGKDGAARYLGLIFDTLEFTEFAIDEILEAGDRVVVIGRETAIVKPTGRPYAQEWGHVLRMSDGKIASIREYNDSATMLAAFRLGTI